MDCLFFGHEGQNPRFYEGNRQESRIIDRLIHRIRGYPLRDLRVDFAEFQDKLCFNAVTARLQTILGEGLRHFAVR